METGADLVFKWVPRMIMFGMYLTGKEPFKTVYFHGMINDEHNQKMSKSKGNVISPVELSEQFGTDAMRMALVIGNGPGNNIPLSHQKVESYRNFTNKLWNIGRYVMAQPKTIETGSITATSADRWILLKLANVIETVTEHLNHARFSFAGEALRDFTWNDFADWYVEVHKIEKNNAVLHRAFETLLKLWHPFMPFVTEALWQEYDVNHTADKERLLMIQAYPRSEAKAVAVSDSSERAAFSVIIDIIKNIRTLRAAYRIDPIKKVTVTLAASNDRRAFLNDHAIILEKLGRLDTLTLSDNTQTEPHHCAYALIDDVKLFVHLEGILDIAAERARLERELEHVTRHVDRLQSQLENACFTSQAPASVIGQTRLNLETSCGTRAELQEHLARLV
jgi:valyl-tRNA synthetase